MENTENTRNCDGRTVHCSECDYWKNKDALDYGTCTCERASEYACRTVGYHMCSSSNRKDDSVMDRQTIINTMKDRGFTLNMEYRDGKGNTTTYDFMSEPIYHGYDKDKIVIPSYSCTIYPDTGEFQFTYAVPKSINKLSTPKCGSFENENHFYRICSRFNNAVRVLYHEFGDD